MSSDSIENIEILCDLIKKGGVFVDVEGESLYDLFHNLSLKMTPPSDVDSATLVSELLQREKILSTAVGHGFAIPHPRKSILLDENNQQLVVCYPKTALDMSAPDGISVSVLFVLLTKNSQLHLCILSNLAKLVHNLEFRQFISSKPDADVLVKKIKELAESGNL